MLTLNPTPRQGVPADIRTTSTTLTQTHREAGVAVSAPTTIVTASAVMANPLAEQGLVQDLSSLEQLGNEVATLLVEMPQTHWRRSVYPRLRQGCDLRYEWGTRTHRTSAPPSIWSTCAPAIGGGVDIIPGTKKVAGPGASIAMQIGNKDDRWVFDDMDSVDVSLPDAPRPDEIVVSLALSVGGRPHARVQKPTS